MCAKCGNCVKREIRIAVSYKLFILEKKFDSSKFFYPPQKCLRLREPINEGRYFVDLEISTLTQHLAKDIFQVECVADLEDFCGLYLFGKGWKLMNEDYLFLKERKVINMIEWLKGDGKKFHVETIGHFGVPSESL